MARRRSDPSPEEIAMVQQYERETLSDFFSSMGSVGDDPEVSALWRAVESLVFARGTGEVMEVIEANPALLTRQGDAVVVMTEGFVQMTGLPFATAILEDRRALLDRMREIDGGTARGR